MIKDNLKETLSKIETWCSQNDISIFYGSIDKNKATKVNWERSGKDDWEKYLNVLKKAGSGILTVTITRNELPVMEDMIDDYITGLEEDEKQEFESALSVIKKNNGQIAYFKLTFFECSISYSYQEEADWIDKYKMVLEAYMFDDDDNELEEEELSEKEIEEWARKVILDEQYLNEKNRYKRNNIARSFLQSDGFMDTHGLYEIADKAEAIFQSEIQPAREALVQKQVLELKAEGVKKIEIASRLKISRDTVNKYYFSD